MKVAKPGVLAEVESEEQNVKRMNMETIEIAVGGEEAIKAAWHGVASVPCRWPSQIVHFGEEQPVGFCIHQHLHMLRAQTNKPTNQHTNKPYYYKSIHKKKQTSTSEI